MKALLSFLLVLVVHAAYSQRTNEGDVEVVFTNTLWEEETLSVKLNPEWFYKAEGPISDLAAVYKSKDDMILVVFQGTMGEEGYTRKQLIKAQNERKDEIQSSTLPGDIMKAVEVIKENGEEGLLIGYAIPGPGEKMLINVGRPARKLPRRVGTVFR